MLFGNPSSENSLRQAGDTGVPGAALRSQASEEGLTITTITVGRINWST